MAWIFPVVQGRSKSDGLNQGPHIFSVNDQMINDFVFAVERGNK
jgi:hypothetical protein